MEEALIKILARKKGISEEEAKLLAEAIKSDADIADATTTLAHLADFAEVSNKLPNTAQPLATALFTQTLMQQQGSSTEKLAERIALITSALRAVEKDDGTQKLIDELRNEIKELREEKVKKEREEMMKLLEDSFSSINDYIKTLEQKISQLEEGKRTSKDEIEVIEEAIQRLEKQKEVLKKLGMVKDADEEKIDLAKAEELLRKAGYKIERPLTWESLQDYLSREIEKIRKEAKKEAMEELKVEEKRLSMIMDIISVIAGAAIDAVSSSQAPPAQTMQVQEIQAEAPQALNNKIIDLRRRFEEWKRMQQEKS